MNEACEIKNGNEKQEKIGSTSINQSINQSSGLHLVQNENLKRLINNNPELENEIKETEKLLNSKLKIKTIEEFDKIVDKINTLKLNTKQMTKGNDYVHVIQKMQKATNQQNIKQYLDEIKFKFYDGVLCKFFSDTIFGEEQQKEEELDNDALQTSSRMQSSLDHLNTSTISHNICSGTHYRFWYMKDTNKEAEIALAINLYYINQFRCFLAKRNRDFIVNHCFLKLFKVSNGYYLDFIRCVIISHIYVSNSTMLLALLSNPDRYDFFLQFHHILEKNLSQEDKQLFYDYLNSCKNKLQIERNRCNYFHEIEWVLTAILVFGIIASATVLTIYFMGIYAATWLFWFGIVGVALTVFVGFRLFFCLKANWNDLKELKLELKQENKTVEDKIAKIDHAMEVYDLNKIKNFKAPEMKKISTLDLDGKETILNNGGTNTNRKENDPKSEQINIEQNIIGP